ncbi:hypothetical protein OPS25_13740 [Alteromonas ponticola]|uniref:Divalent cation transporter n=1 Tax=Alteromonas aquimaris TaxID=2998417 RepID=A0ABT3P9V8_9ALTE|nr:hypothetical protein [Alteromonas aquimaris]MCW8109566.1 hypothetical protein [Alteromonas aquimaris]
MSQCHTTRHVMRISGVGLSTVLKFTWGIIGYLWSVDSPLFVAAIMLIASGGILYTLFQDMAPQVAMKNHWFPPMGAIIGFTVGVIGMMLEQS